MLSTFLGVAIFLVLPLAVEVFLAPRGCVLLLTAPLHRKPPIGACLPQPSTNLVKTQHESVPTDCHQTTPSMVEWRTAACGNLEQSDEFGIESLGYRASA